MNPDYKYIADITWSDGAMEGITGSTWEDIEWYVHYRMENHDLLPDYIEVTRVEEEVATACSR